MARLTYAEQIKHPNWQKRRLERLSLSDWQCEDCGSGNVTLHVHHKRYIKGRMAWEYSDDDLIVLCEHCHESAHYIEGEINDILLRVDQTEAMALLGGFNCRDLDPDLIERVSHVEALAFHIGACASIVQFLDIDKIAKVARFAASLSNKNSEARPICEKWFGKFPDDKS